MRRKMLAKFSSCFWFLLAVSFLMLLSSFAGNAQNDSALDLAGTEWVKDGVTIPNGVDNSVITVVRYYAFDKQGKLKSTVLTVKSAGLKYEYVYDYNPASRRYEYRYKYVPTPSASNSNVLEGTYTVSGKSIIIDLPDCTIGANIEGTLMQGVVTYKQNNLKEEWRVTRTKQATSTNNSNQNNSTGGNPTESLNKSLPLSMKERLPERLGQFQRTSFETATRAEKQNGGFDTSGFTAAPVVPAGGVESAVAKYGEVRVEVTRFEDPTKATNYLQGYINEQSSDLIVKRVPVKNHTGQSVGELVVMQDPQKHSEDLNEVVAFTHGVYYYWIGSRDLGEAQKIQNLLPLESRTTPNIAGVWEGKIWQASTGAEFIYAMTLEQSGNSAIGRAVVQPVRGGAVGEFDIRVTVYSNSVDYKDLALTRNSLSSGTAWCIKEGRLNYDSKNSNRFK